MAIPARWIRQAAAIPVRDGLVCLITSSNGRRWVMPKGMMEPGKSTGEIALQEAWEEAGIAPALLALFIWNRLVVHRVISDPGASGNRFGPPR